MKFVKKLQSVTYKIIIIDICSRKSKFSVIAFSVYMPMRTNYYCSIRIAMRITRINMQF